MTKPRPRLGNRNAAKPPEQRASASLNARVPAGVKAKWEAHARDAGAKSWAKWLIAHAPEAKTGSSSRTSP